jgi:Fe-S cluster biosynthesis and repair protein YggX
MARLVNCIKLGREAEGLDRPTYPGPLGQRIFEQVSKAAWAEWLKQQTMLINHYGLNVMDPQARTFLTRNMEAFLFKAGQADDVDTTKQGTITY